MATFVEAYNKKHADNALSEDAVHFERKDGTEIPFDAPVDSFMRSEEDLYLRGGASQSMSALHYKPVYVPEGQVGSAEEAGATAAPRPTPAAAPKPSLAAAIAAADAKLEGRPAPLAGGVAGGAGAGAGSKQCKRFGCNKRYVEADNSATACRHHVKPPVFHETRKFWSCCPDRVAWDWESFQAIQGCSEGCHSDQAAQQQFLGGTEMRAEQELALDQSTPQRLNAAGSMDQLSALRRALVGLGVSGAVFDAARDRVKTRYEGTDKVWELVAADLARHVEAALQQQQ